MMEKTEMTSVYLFFLDKKKISFIYNVAHFWIQVELCMYNEVGHSFFKYIFLNL